MPLWLVTDWICLRPTPLLCAARCSALDAEISARGLQSSDLPYDSPELTGALEASHQAAAAKAYTSFSAAIEPVGCDDKKTSALHQVEGIYYEATAQAVRDAARIRAATAEAAATMAEAAAQAERDELRVQAEKARADEAEAEAIRLRASGFASLFLLHAFRAGSGFV